MKPVMQTLFYDKDGTGNCFEACLASILDMNISDIPMFHEGDWFQRLWQWLKEKGLTCHGTISPEDVLTYSDGIDGYFIVAGESPRGKHIRGGHAVVFKNGKMIHDPHPDGTGVVSIKYGLTIEKEKIAPQESIECGENQTDNSQSDAIPQK
jgi:hypothetical protein